MTIKISTIVNMVINVTAIIAAYFLLSPYSFLALAALLAAAYVIKESENFQLQFEKACFLDPKLSPLIFELKPSLIERSSNVSLETKYARDTQIVGTKGNGQFNFLFSDTVGYIIFEDGTYEETIEGGPKP